MFKRFAPVLLVLLLLVGAAVLVIDRGLPDIVRLQGGAVSPTSEAAFESWLAKEADRATEFREFEAFLVSEGVGNVVPAWQLTRVDAFYAGRCEISPFAIPPENLWQNIVPALRLVREEVIGTVGPVRVLSSYRTPELNACARGAGRSKHLSFSALDLATVDGRRGETLYRDLCLMHEQAGHSSRMGLGAYYDFNEPEYGGGRFHIDAEGYRDWGRSYTAQSSPCGRFR